MVSVWNFKEPPTPQKKARRWFLRPTFIILFGFIALVLLTLLWVNLRENTQSLQEEYIPVIAPQQNVLRLPPEEEEQGTHHRDKTVYNLIAQKQVTETPRVIHNTEEQPIPTGETIATTSNSAQPEKPYTVQLSALKTYTAASHEKKRLLSIPKTPLNDKNISIFPYTVKNEKIFRVYYDQFPTKEEANKACEMLKQAHSLPCFVQKISPL